MDAATAKSIIADLADRFAQIGIPVLEAARAQASITIILTAVVLVVFIITVCVSLYLAYWEYQSGKESGRYKETQMASGCFFVSFIFVVLFGAGFAVLLPDAITAWLNPDWYAINKVLQLVKR